MAEGDEKTEGIMILRPPRIEFFPNHPNESKRTGPTFLSIKTGKKRKKRSEGWLIGKFIIAFFRIIIQTIK